MRAIVMACAICIAAASRADAEVCILKRETPSISLKRCWYGCAAGDVPMTIRVMRPCPLKIEHKARKYKIEQ